MSTGKKWYNQHKPLDKRVEAIEYGTPTIYANGSVLLYVLSMPKLRKDLYHQLIIRTPITNGKQIELPYDEVLINEAETYGRSCYRNDHYGYLVPHQL